MNTKGLFENKEFAPFYAALKAQSDCIVSTPATAMWSGEHSALYGGIAVCQPITLRVWVGIQLRELEDKTRRSMIELSKLAADHITFPPPGDKSAELDWLASGEAGPGELANKISGALQYLADWLLGGTRFENGYHIVVRSISEEPPGAGGNWSGAFAASVASAVLIATKQLSEDVAHSWTTAPSELLADDAEFMNCVRASWALETALHGGRASGYGPVCALIGGPHPIVYCTEERLADDHIGRGDDEPPINVKSNFHLLDEIKIGFARLPEILGEDRGAGFPGFRCGLVHTGAPKDTGEAIVSAIEEAKAAQNAEEHLQVRHIYDKGSLTKVASRSLASRMRPDLFSLDNQRPFPLGIGAQMAAVARGSGHVLEALLKLYESVGQRTREHELALVASLAGRIRVLESALEQLHLDWTQGRSVSAEIYQCVADKNAYEQTGVKLTGGGRGGSLWFVLPAHPETLLDDIHRHVEGMRVHETTAHMLWNSRDDKVEMFGLRVGDGWLLKEPRGAAISVDDRTARFAEVWRALSTSGNVPRQGAWHVDLSEYEVVGGYVRDTAVCTKLQTGIVAEANRYFLSARTGWSPEVWVLWGPSSAGKTALMEAIGSALEGLPVKTTILDLSSPKVTESNWNSKVAEATEDDCARLTVIDEIHSRLNWTWPYSALCAPAATGGRGHPLILAMLGSESGGDGPEELKRRIRHAGETGELGYGNDLMNRVTHHPDFTIPPMTPLEVAYALLSSMLYSAQQANSTIDRIELGALLYLVDKAINSDVGGSALRAARLALGEAVRACAAQGRPIINCSYVMANVDEELEGFCALLNTQGMTRDGVIVSAERRRPT